jgi:hypothetical protein
LAAEIYVIAGTQVAGLVDFDEEQLKAMYVKFHAEEEQNGMITREKFDKVQHATRIGSPCRCSGDHACR